MHLNNLKKASDVGTTNNKQILAERSDKYTTYAKRTITTEKKTMLQFTFLLVN